MDETPLPGKVTCRNQRIAVRTVSATTIFPRLERARLPPELIDIIIGLLRADQDTLATCALVCKSWVPASRCHLSWLFSEFTLCPWTHSILSSPACTITAAVQHLVLETIEDFEDLYEITSRLSNTTHLTLCKSNQRDTHFSSYLSQVTCSPFMKDLESLELSHISFDTQDVFLSLLHHCPRLQSMSCYAVSFFSRSIPQSRPNDQDAVSPELKILEVHKSYGLLDYIVRYWDSTTPRLTTLNLDLNASACSLPSAERLLDAVGSSLQDLRLINIRKDLSFADRNFASLTQLRYLTLELVSWGDTFALVQYTVHALQHLTSPYLQEVTILLGGA